MNDWNELENRLRSWAPRAPSPKIKARLFPAPAVRAAALPAEANGPANWHWLAPAMAMFVLCMFVAGRTPNYLPGFGGVNSTSFVAAAAFNDPHLASYSEASHHSEANMPPVKKFSSAKEGRASATLTPSPTTNSLIPIE